MMELTKIRKVATVSLGLHLDSLGGGNARWAALTALAMHLGRRTGGTDMQKAASVGLALHLSDIKPAAAHNFTAKDVAVAALAFHLAMDERQRQFAPQAYQRNSDWAFKGFLLSRTPDRKFR